MSRRRTSDPIVAVASLLGTGLLGIGKFIWRLIRGEKARTGLNKVQLFADWQQIYELADSNDSARLAQAVQQADRFVDHVMQQVGGRGPTFADRLRSLEQRFDHATYQGLWDAHKLRNTLAHQHGSQALPAEVQRAMNQFRAAARTLGAF